MFEQITANILSYGLQVIVTIILLVIGLKIIKAVVNRVKKSMEKKDVDPTIIQFSTSLAGIILKILLVLALLATVGVEVTSFIAILGAASFAVGMALQGSLANFAAGVILLILRPFKVGDFVELNGLTGVVSSIQVFSTILKTPDNKTVIIPNGNIIGSNIINYSEEDQRRVDFTFGVDYGADIKKVKEVLYDVASSHKLVLKDPDVFIGLAELGDSSVNFAVRAWAKTADYWTVYFDVMEEMKLRLDAEGISIPYPHIQIVKE